MQNYFVKLLQGYPLDLDNFPFHFSFKIIYYRPFLFQNIYIYTYIQCIYINIYMSCKKMFIISLRLLTAREVGGGVKALADVAILCTFFTCTSIYVCICFDTR